MPTFKIPALAGFGLFATALLVAFLALCPLSTGRSYAAVQGVSGGGGTTSSPPTYTVTGTTYVTLQTPSGAETFCQFNVSVSGGTGGGAVDKATACGKDVSDCVKGTVSGAAGAVLVNVSSAQCEKAMRGCAKITITLRNGNKFDIDVPGFLCSINVNLMGASEFAAGVYGFPATAVRCVTTTIGGGAAGTIGSLPFGPPVEPMASDATVHFELITNGNGPFATFADTNGQLKTSVTLVRGVGVVYVDCSNCSPGATVIIEARAHGFDTSRKSFTIK